MALWHFSRRAISCAKAVSAVSEKDCCVLKFVFFGIASPTAVRSLETAVASTPSSSTDSFPGWKYLRVQMR